MNKRLNTYSEQLELAFSSELREEYRKALSWAELYKENTRRIRTLLSYNPVTMTEGEALVSGNNGLLLILSYRNVDSGFINPVLL
ncbi:MAG: hypothetical protein ACXACY_30975 [Candidatus Hodarchaeales archaeon]|jgi:hypothetical protein